MSGIINFLVAMSPPPPPSPHDNFQGLEYRWKAIVFRPAMFKFEGIMFGVIGAYLLLYTIGRTINMSRAKSAIAQYENLLSSNFAATRPLVSSGPSQHLSYSSGRRNVLCLHGTLSLLPYHDVAGMVMHVGRSIIEPAYDASEGLVWGLTLGRGESGLQGEGFGVWAVVDKGQMRQVREKRWDLTFPRLHENVAVPITHSLFSEHSDCTDILLKTPSIGITELLANKTAAGVLKYLLITDQPSGRPQKGALPTRFRTREVILSVRRPSNTVEIDAVKAWLQVCFNIADLEAKANVVKPEVTRKLGTTRKTVDSDLSKDYAKEVAEDAPPEMTAEEKRLAKKKAEKANMSEKELKKIEELEKKREMRKMQKKGMSKSPN